MRHATGTRGTARARTVSPRPLPTTAPAPNTSGGRTSNRTTRWPTEATRWQEALASPKRARLNGESAKPHHGNRRREGPADPLYDDDRAALAGSLENERTHGRQLSEATSEERRMPSGVSAGPQGPLLTAEASLPDPWRVLPTPPERRSTVPEFRFLGRPTGYEFQGGLQADPERRESQSGVRSEPQGSLLTADASRPFPGLPWPTQPEGRTA